MKFDEFCKKSNCFTCDYKDTRNISQCRRKYEKKQREKAQKETNKIYVEVKEVSQGKEFNQEKEQVRQLKALCDKLEFEKKALENTLEEITIERDLLLEQKENLVNSNIALLEKEVTILSDSTKLIDMLNTLMRENTYLKEQLNPAKAVG